MQILLQSILWLVIIGIIYVVVNWGIARMGLPDLINKVINWMMVATVIVLVVNIILTIVGHPLFSLPRLSFHL